MAIFPNKTVMLHGLIDKPVSKTYLKRGSADKSLKSRGWRLLLLDKEKLWKGAEKVFLSIPYLNIKFLLPLASIFFDKPKSLLT